MTRIRLWLRVVPLVALTGCVPATRVVCGPETRLALRHAYQVRLETISDSGECEGYPRLPDCPEAAAVVRAWEPVWEARGYCPRSE